MTSGGGSKKYEEEKEKKKKRRRRRRKKKKKIKQKMQSTASTLNQRCTATYFKTHSVYTESATLTSF